MISVEHYLERIGITERRKPDLEFLTELHRAHLLQIPFETYDIHTSIPIVCEEDLFLHKIIERKRGGFCYELNTSFAWLLRNLGYHVEMLSGRVSRATGGFGPEFDHMFLLVHLDEDYIADVGFTNFCIMPLQLSGLEKTDTLGRSRIQLTESGDHAFLRFEEEAWKTEYLFSLDSHELQEYAGMCRFHESSPESPFIAKPLAVLYTPTGRVTLKGNTLIRNENGVTIMRELGEEEKNTTLRNIFGIYANKIRN